jgi:transposase-like protein
LQDRVPKELVLAGITTMAEANAWLRDTYIPAHNARFATQAEQHRTKLHSTNPLERLQRRGQAAHRCRCIFPNEAAIIRLVGAILLEQNDEGTVQRARYMALETIAPLSENAIVSLPAVAG